MTRAGAALVVGQSLDALTLACFYAVAGYGREAERNPAVLALMSLGGTLLVVAAKVGLSLGAALLYGRRPRGRLLTGAVLAAAASGFVGFAANSWAIMEAAPR